MRAPRRSENRYEHRAPGDMIHVDVKKLGRIPASSGWRLHGRDASVSVANRHKKVQLGYDYYVHAAIDDHTRLAYSEVRTDEKTRPARRSCTAHWPCRRCLLLNDIFVNARQGVR